MKMKRGFTLVELSIVLVIIGLLIGGILTARSLIESAHIQGFGKQISQYDIMTQNFITRYGVPPGDSPSFTPAGNGDGSVTASVTTSGFPAATDNEIRGFWPQLKAAGMLNDNKTYASNWTFACCDNNLPCIKDFKLEYTGDYSTIYCAANPKQVALIAFSYKGKLYWETVAFAYYNGNFSGVYFSNRQLADIEAKYDDGAISTGKIRRVHYTYDSVLQSVAEGGTCPTYGCNLSDYWGGDRENFSAGHSIRIEVGGQ